MTQNQKLFRKQAECLDDFVANLQAENLAPGTINNHVKGVKALFRCNGLKLELPYNLSKRSIYEDRAPAPEELQKMLDLADLRERVIISLLALGGFRIGTLSKLQYRHVKRNLEKRHNPNPRTCRIRYNQREISRLRYIPETGSSRIPQSLLGLTKTRQPNRTKNPEIIHDNSPLIRNGQSNLAKPITTGRIHSVVHNLYVKAGLVTSNPRGRRYDLRAHSIRKYFRTQLASLSIQTDYIEYMMGHTISTYHDIRMKGRAAPPRRIHLLRTKHKTKSPPKQT